MSQTGNKYAFIPQPVPPSGGTGGIPLRDKRNAKSRSFTLIEVLISVAILSVGMIGVIRAYIVLMNSVGVANFTVEASYQLKNGMAVVENNLIDGGVTSQGPDYGASGIGHKAFASEEEVSQIIVEGEEPKKDPKAEGTPEKKPQEILNKARISVFGGEGFGPVRKMSLYTYLEGRPE